MDARPRYSSARSVLGASVGWLGISMVADGLPTLMLPYRLTDLGTTDATSFGLLTLVVLGGAALAQPFAGRWSDAHGRAGMLAVGVAVAGAGLMVLAVAPSTMLVVLGFGTAMLGVSLAQAGQQPLLADHVPPSERGTGSGLKGAFDVGGALLGFAVLAALLGGGNLTLAVSVLLVTLLGSVAVGLVLLKRAQPGEVRDSTSLDERPAATRERPVLEGDRRAQLVRLVVARFLFLLGVFVVGRFLFLLVSGTTSSPEAAAELAGTILLALAAVTVAASLPAGWLADRVGRRVPMLVGGMLAAIGIAGLALAATPTLMLAAGVLLALGSAAFSAGSWAALADAAAGPNAGRLLGLANLGTAGAAAGAGAFGLVIDGAAQQVPGTGFVVAFGLAALSALAGGVLAWRVSQSAAPQDTPAAQRIATATR